MLAFLREHMHAADDLTVRWRWTPGAVAIWDNRSVAHRAVPGGYDTSQREGKRTAIFGEQPVYDPTGQTWSERYDSRQFQDKEGFDYVSKNANVTAQ